MHLEPPSRDQPVACCLQADSRPALAFTLVELLVVMSILAILASIALGGMTVGLRKGRAEVTKFMVRKLSAAIMDRYEDYEDLAGTMSLLQIRAKIREEMPDSWFDVFGSSGSNLTVPPTTPAGRAYARYYAAGPAPTSAYASAECLYMIITQSGLFHDMLSEIRPEQIGDIDNDGKKEFWDGWKRPIAFFRWAPGFSSDPPALGAGRRDYSPIQIADPDNYHDPIDIAGADSAGFAMYPLIYSAGADESTNDPNAAGPNGYGMVTAVTGWSNASLSSPCVFSDGTSLIGAPDPTPANANAYRDNIFSHDLTGN